MPDLFFPAALLPSGWATAVRLRVDGHGRIQDVEADADASGARSASGVAVPGVTNLHSHAFQRALAGLTEVRGPEGDTFWTWRERMYAFTRRLGPDDVEAIATQLYVELLRHGFTAVGEFHYLRNPPGGGRYDDPVEMGRRILASARVAGIGLTLLPVLYRTADFGGVPAEEAQGRFTADVDEILQDVDTLTGDMENDPSRRAGLALHSLRAVPPDALERAVGAFRAQHPHGPVHIHVAEQVREVEACVAWSGQRPVDWLLDHAPVDDGWCLVHATHMTAEETRRVAASGAVAGLCPTTEANLGDGLFPLPEYLAAGGNLGVGTDSHVSVSPAAELRMLEYGQRLVHRSRNLAASRPGTSTGRRLVELALAGGARAAGCDTGRIEPGARADLVILDADHPALVGRQGDEILDAWIFSGEDTPVRDVMVGGTWVVEDGRHVRQDEVAERYRAAARRLLA